MANSINATSTGNGGIITTGDDSGVLNIQTNETTAISIDASQSVDFTNNIDAPNTFGFKNRIINGAMVIDQRNAGASVTPANGGYLVDRFAYYSSQNSKFTAQQNAGSVTPPAGFVNYLGFTSSSSYSLGSSDYFAAVQVIEGYNIADLGWGTASAKAVTLSFQVYSSLTGTFGGSLCNAGSTRSYPFTYTISAANTWTTISVTVAGDTSGTWLKTNSTGLTILFGLGVGATYSGTAGSWAGANYVSATGATSVVGTSGATFYITGVQLEKGTQATSFDFRSYGTELQLCQRYLPAYSSYSGFESICAAYSVGTTTAYATFPFQTPARVPPTGLTASSAAHFGLATGGGSGITATSISFTASSNLSCLVSGVVASGLTLGQGSYLYSQSASAKLLFTGCEL